MAPTRPQPGAGSGDVPWLSPDRNAERHVANARLRALLGRPDDLPADLKERLACAAGSVLRFEQDVARVDTLLQRSRTEMLNAVEWRELSDRVASARGYDPAIESDWDDGVCRGALSSSDTETLRALRQRVDDARSYLYSDDLPWEDTVRRTVTKLPVGPGEPVAVDSRIVPGAALGACFAQGYPALESALPNSMAWYMHVPGLALTVLTDADGRTLFSGVRHSLIHPRRLSEGFLAGLPDGELRVLAEDCYADRNPYFHVIPTWTLRVEKLVQDMRSGGGAKHWAGSALACYAGDRMADEIVSAALVGEAVKFRRALHGETVSLNLYFISVATEDDREAWRFQGERLHSLWFRACGPQALYMRCPNGEVRQVMVDIKVRSFVVSAGSSRDNPEYSCTRYAKFHKLLGPRESPDLGGEAKLQFDRMNRRARELRGELAGLGWLHLRNGSVGGMGPLYARGACLGSLAEGFCSGGGTPSRFPAEGSLYARGAPSRSPAEGSLFARGAPSRSPAEGSLYARGTPSRSPAEGSPNVEIRGRLIELNGEAERLEGNARALAEAGRQLKAMWIDNGGDDCWPAGAEAHRPVAARLALVAHLMGWTPVLSCAEGADHIERLDPEIKFLATVAAHRNGMLPPRAGNAGAWARARGDFRPQ